MAVTSGGDWYCSCAFDQSCKNSRRDVPADVISTNATAPNVCYQVLVFYLTSKKKHDAVLSSLRMKAVSTVAITTFFASYYDFNVLSGTKRK